ncbi:MAG: hypothetical protein H7Y31_16350 [Chitinophagaceae bacterium]|nr:hypothetical protein [Chitinophagaceae bacterium]
MKSSLKIQSTPSTKSTIFRLALLGGFVFGSLYVFLLAFEALAKAF